MQNVLPNRLGWGPLHLRATACVAISCRFPQQAPAQLNPHCHPDRGLYPSDMLMTSPFFAGQATHQLSGRK